MNPRPCWCYHRTQPKTKQQTITIVPSPFPDGRIPHCKPRNLPRAERENLRRTRTLHMPFTRTTPSRTPADLGGSSHRAPLPGTEQKCPYHADAMARQRRTLATYFFATHQGRELALPFQQSREGAHHHHALDFAAVVVVTGQGAAAMDNALPEQGASSSTAGRRTAGREDGCPRSYSSSGRGNVSGATGACTRNEEHALNLFRSVFADMAAPGSLRHCSPTRRRRCSRTTSRSSSCSQ